MNTVATCIAIPLVTKNEPRIDSRELALNLDRPHQTVYELVKKYQTENTMQLRVPTEKLGALLTFINDKKLFLMLLFCLCSALNMPEI